MQRKIINLLIFFSTLYTFGATNAALSVEKVTEVRKNIPCPSNVFPEFLGRFSSDETIQREFTAELLIVQSLEVGVNPEPKLVVKVLPKRDVKFPVMPLAKERMNNSLRIKFLSVSLSRAEVELFKPDTDYKTSFFFEKKGCWKLVRVEDWSL